MTFRDGFGDRFLAAETVGGVPVEVLCLRGDMSDSPAFELALRDRAARLARFRSESYARVICVHRCTTTRELAIVSEHVEGIRLSALLRAAGTHQIPVDLNTALSVTRQLLRATIQLHEFAPDLVNGLIAPERLLVTPRAGVAIAEQVLGAGVEQLRYDPDRLWRELRVAARLENGTVRFTHRSDLLSIALVALSLMLGRSLEDDEQADTLPALLAAAAERSIPGWAPLSPALRDWLARALQLDPHHAFASTTEALRAFEQMIEADSLHLSLPLALEKFLYRCTTALLQPSPVNLSAHTPRPARPHALAGQPRRPELTSAEPVMPPLHAGESMLRPVTPPWPMAVPERVEAARADETIPSAPTLAPPAPEQRLAVGSTQRELTAPEPVAFAPRHQPPATSHQPTAESVLRPVTPPPAVAVQEPLEAADPGGTPTASNEPRGPVLTASDITRLFAESEPAPVEEQPSRSEPVEEPAVLPACEPATGVSTLEPMATSADMEPMPEMAFEPIQVTMLDASWSDPAASPTSWRPLTWAHTGTWTRARTAVALGLVALLVAGLFLNRALRPEVVAASEGGTLVIGTNPEGMDVLVDGVDFGRTPVRLSLPAGDHTVEVRGSGVVRTLPVTIARGAEVAHHLEFVDGMKHTSPSPTTGTSVQAPAAPEGAASEPTFGWVQVRSERPITVRIGDRSFTPSSGQRIRFSVGRHQIQLLNEATGERTVQTVDVLPGKVTWVRMPDATGGDVR
jgi:hypothetical protein